MSGIRVRSVINRSVISKVDSARMLQTEELYPVDAKCVEILAGGRQWKMLAMQCTDPYCSSCRLYWKILVLPIGLALVNEERRQGESSFSFKYCTEFSVAFYW